jgi:tRNA(Ile)-lysidine synthase TilS/MesJ
VTGSTVVLTVAHIDHDLTRNGPDNLRHWCQRCHNTHDAHHRAKTRKNGA